MALFFDKKEKFHKEKEKLEGRVLTNTFIKLMFASDKS